MNGMQWSGLLVAAIAGLFLASHRSSLVANEIGDANCAVVDVMQPNRLIDVDPGDQFWLTVPAGNGLTAV
jgi:hypothetical protein